jgi:hypothetical protein
MATLFYGERVQLGRVRAILTAYKMVGSMRKPNIYDAFVEWT